jgi:hypothetical protein
LAVRLQIFIDKNESIAPKDGITAGGSGQR